MPGRTASSNHAQRFPSGGQQCCPVRNRQPSRLKLQHSRATRARSRGACGGTSPCRGLGRPHRGPTWRTGLGVPARQAWHSTRPLAMSLSRRTVGPWQPGQMTQDAPRRWREGPSSAPSTSVSGSGRTVWRGDGKESAMKPVHAQQQTASASTPTLTGLPHRLQVNVFRFVMVLASF